MRRAITISIPNELKKDLDRFTREEGVSRSDVVRECLRDYLWVRRFRRIRTRMAARAAVGPPARSGGGGPLEVQAALGAALIAIAAAATGLLGEGTGRDD